MPKKTDPKQSEEEVRNVPLNSNIPDMQAQDARDISTTEEDADDLPEETKAAIEKQEKAFVPSTQVEADKQLAAEELLGNIEADYDHIIIHATKRSQKQMYKPERVIPIDGEPMIETEEERRHKLFLELVASAKSNKIMTGTIDGVAMISNTPCAQVFLQDFTIYIPFEKLIPKERLTSLDNVADKDLLTMKKLMVNQRQGSEINFIILNVDEGNRIAMASRVAAMKQIRSTYWWTPNKTSGEYKINEGDKVEARVCCVTKSGVAVEIFGKEVFILAHDIAYQRVDPLQTYLPGDRVLCRIVTLKRTILRKGDKRSLKMDLYVTIKDAQASAASLHYDQFRVGGVYRAQVTWIDEKGIFVLLSDVFEAKCYFAAGQTDVPDVGDLLQVRVLKKWDESKHIACEITKVLKKAKRSYI